MDPTEAIAVGGRDVIIVEHEFLLAEALANQLTDLGARVVGRAATLQRARELVASRNDLDLVIADIRLGEELATPLILDMVARGAEVVLSTVLSAREIPPELAVFSCLRKPYDPATAFTARKSPSSLAYSRSGSP